MLSDLLNLDDGSEIALGLTVLVAVFVIGVLAGSARGRFALLLVGVAAVLGLGVIAAGIGGLDPRGLTAAQLTTLYGVVLPPLAVFLAGWLCARGSWFRRVVVVAVVALLLAAFPYAAAGAATADALTAAAP